MQLELESRARKEHKEEIEAEIIQFLKSSVFESNFINTKSRKETKQSARVLNNWEKAGLIDKINSNEGKFRTYNKSQEVWIDIISTLREFGFALEKIKKVKEKIFDSIFLKENKYNFTNSILELGIMQSILAEPMILVIFHNGDANILSKNQYREELLLQPFPPHLHFNLLNLAINAFPNNNFSIIRKSDKKGNLNDKELALLYFIRTGDFDSIKIRLKEDDIVLFEGTKKISNKSKITEIINQGNFQDIEIKTQNGEIVHISSTQKIKLTE